MCLCAVWLFFLSCRVHQSRQLNQIRNANMWCVFWVYVYNYYFSSLIVSRFLSLQLISFAHFERFNFHPYAMCVCVLCMFALTSNCSSLFRSIFSSLFIVLVHLDIFISVRVDFVISTLVLLLLRDYSCLVTCFSSNKVKVFSHMNYRLDFSDHQFEHLIWSFSHEKHMHTQASQIGNKRKMYISLIIFLFSFYFFRVEPFFKKTKRKWNETNWNEFKISVELFNTNYTQAIMPTIRSVVCSRWNVCVCKHM